MSKTRDQLVGRYLKDLMRATAGLSRPQRRQLRDEVLTHLNETIPADATPTQVAAALEEFGSVEAVADQFDQRAPAARRKRRAILIVAWTVVAILALMLAIVVMPSVFALLP
ncbi:hypothetical protein BOH66_01210 [Microbacterium aurum]|uniref:Uncharacterized protein n=1 Tax=Microbacterium aurum TaxID=36805 RepID=A0A1P8U4M9_9MICO|nr:hypothetical protein [Microbacterium aurum]APZ33069.1 hypothetical protein BOH66_01210 [Microbacterium aurum]MBM7826627.1 flagellar basal body-associated protein FliL [Microbacterium aurum]